ncbi:hypothetical protein HK102_008477 [Quaeritorhiza haematococci]|nr:hypothetical protein HK102_008477 [Quaeritorhiza haematococci]
MGKKARSPATSIGSDSPKNVRPPVLSWPIELSNQAPRPVKLAGVQERQIVDRFGRQRFFRGVNVVYKVTPYFPVYDEWDPKLSFNDDDINLLSDLNINVIRLGIMWPGVEPERGQYNETYIKIMKNLVDKCRDKDVLSEKFCGEGVPLWAADPTGPLGTRSEEHEHEELIRNNTPGVLEILAEKLPHLFPKARVAQLQGQIPSIKMNNDGRVGENFVSRFEFPYPLEKVPYPVDERGVPSPEDCAKHGWVSYHFAMATSQAYQNIYDNKNGIREALGAFWKRIAAEFKDYPNLLGYDIMNEPWAGNIYANPSLLSPGVADRVNLQKMYNQAHQSIREVDDEGLIFFESVTWDNLVVGFTGVPGGRDYRNRTVLSYHYYNPKPNIFSIDKTFRERMLDVQRLGCGMMLTEFDIAWANGEGIPRLYEYLSKADDFLQSWIGWEYKPFFPMTGYGDSLFDPETGEIRHEMVRIYARTFAHAVAGHLQSVSFDMKTGVFRMQYLPSMDEDGSNGNSGDGEDLSRVTEIRIHRSLWYPRGFTVQIFPEDWASWRASEDNNNLILIEHVPASLRARRHRSSSSSSSSSSSDAGIEVTITPL